MNPRAEAVRIRYLYRTLILKGRLRLPPEAARALVGPDCAYHLYRVHPPGPGGSSRPGGPREPPGDGSGRSGS